MGTENSLKYWCLERFCICVYFLLRWNHHFACFSYAGDGSEWAKNTDWPLDQQRLNMQIEQYKKERIHKKHDHSQRPKKHDLQAMIATLGSDDSASDETDGKSTSGDMSNQN